MNGPTSDEVFRGFIAECTRRDVDAAVAVLADDVEYDNVPIGKVFGPAAVRGMLTGDIFAAAAECEWLIVRQVATGPVVMNERIDRFRIGDRWLEIRWRGSSNSTTAVFVSGATTSTWGTIASRSTTCA